MTDVKHGTEVYFKKSRAFAVPKKKRVKTLPDQKKLLKEIVEARKQIKAELFERAPLSEEEYFKRQQLLERLPSERAKIEAKKSEIPELLKALPEELADKVALVLMKRAEEKAQAEPLKVERSDATSLEGKAMEIALMKVKIAGIAGRLVAQGFEPDSEALYIRVRDEFLRENPTLKRMPQGSRDLIVEAGRRAKLKKEEIKTEASGEGLDFPVVDLSGKGLKIRKAKL